MRHRRANGDSGAPVGAPLSGLAANYKDPAEDTFPQVRAPKSSVIHAFDGIASGLPVAGALAAGLTPPSRRGERSPMTPSGVGEGDLPGGPGSPLPYDVAAVLCGHDITTAAGAEAARHDYRVWDLAEELQP